MVQPKKPNTSKILCAKIKDIHSVLELSDFVTSTRLPILGVELEADIWHKLKLKDAVVLETLAMRLRELIEAGKLTPYDLEDSSDEAQDDEPQDYDP